ncbi:DUF5320 domain-containing protein [Chloroflexota bacterium]
MQGFNRTGPRGMGPMTGGGRGFCNTRGARTAYQGYGFGFRSASPAWPYIGRGRGGLSRCWYPGIMGGTAAPNMSSEQEIDMLKSQAHAMREHLEQLEARIKQLGNQA